MGRSLRVALLVESSHGFGRGVLRGIAAYARQYGPWTFHHEERAFDDPLPPGLALWKPDGVIARIPGAGLARQLRRLRVPIVNLYEQHQGREESRVLVNHRAVARMAVDHLRECGLQNFAYVGFPRLRFSLQRAQFFAECVAMWQFRPYLYIPSLEGKTSGLAAIESKAMYQAAPLAEWLRQLPKPVGVMGCNDMQAQQVLSVCGECGIAVPDSVAVIGVDNDEVRCDIAAPHLSSVDPNAFGVGYEAARLLHRLVRGGCKSPQTVLVDPVGVVPRQSTDIVAFVAPEVGEIVRYIREHACKGLSIEGLIRHSGLSRATLDRWFLRNLGRTPYAEITRLRVQRLRELLATTDLPLKQLARLSGFSRVETMYRVFAKATGQTPAEYRRTTSFRRSPIHPSIMRVDTSD